MYNSVVEDEVLQAVVEEIRDWREAVRILKERKENYELSLEVRKQIILKNPEDHVLDVQFKMIHRDKKCIEALNSVIKELEDDLEPFNDIW